MFHNLDEVYKLNSKEFAHYAKSIYNRVPIVREVVADLETPLTVYLKLANAKNSYLFESVQGGEKWGRYSLIGLQSNTTLMISDYNVKISRNGKRTSSYQTKDPLSEVENFRKSFRAPVLPYLPRFCGGLVGYFGYDTVRYEEPILSKSMPRDALGIPDIFLMVSDEIVVFDNLKGTLSIIVHADPSECDAWVKATTRLDEIQARLKLPIPMLPELNLNAVIPVNFISSFKKADYIAAVERVKEYILAGDIMQVVPSQRLSARFFAPAINLYRALRLLNPSPYLYFIQFEMFQIVGSSPEVLARVEDDLLTVRPIAGTRPRGENRVEDEKLEQEMLSDPKELAEHLMLIDLGRNDVGRVSVAGSVEVTEKMVVERYSHVMHITSNVVGRVKPELGPLDIIRATLPAGTLSGAPKIRAMQIIDELEPVKRNIYGGAIGYIGWNGNIDTAIAIRTAVIKDETLYVQAGGGVVADSDPEMEWQETMNKAKAVIKAAGMANKRNIHDSDVG